MAQIQYFQARTKRPITAYPLVGDGTSRVIPGGALVSITENLAPVTENRPAGDAVLTATIYLDGSPFETEIRPDQFTRIAHLTTS